MDSNLKLMLISAFLIAVLIFTASSVKSFAADYSNLSRGINLWEWFKGVGNVNVPDRAVRRGKITPGDIQTLSRAGFNNVRIGISPYSLLPSPLPSSPAQFDACATLHDREFISDLEEAIAAFHRAGIAAIVTVMFEGPAKDRLRTDRAFAVGCLGPFWAAFSSELAGKFSSHDTYFDLINEPDIITTMPTDPQKWEKSAAMWGSIQDSWIKTIRQRISSDYVLILSSDGWDTSYGVPYMRRPNGPNLIMSFHFYANEVFTHQKQSWYDPLVGEISELAYPPAAASCKANLGKVDRKLSEGWYERLVNYCGGHWSLEADLAQVRKWSAANADFPVWVGEFGALGGAPMESRIRWYQDVLSAFITDKFIGHALVDYSDAIGCNRLADESCVFVSQQK